MKRYILFSAFFVLTAIASNSSAKHSGWTNWTVYDHYNSSLPDNYVRALAIEGSNKWIGTQYGGLAKFDGTNWTVFNESNSGLPDNYVYALAIEGSNIWVGTWGGGLAKFDGTIWTVFNESNSGLPDNSIHALVIEGNNIWIGTGGGLAVYNTTGIEENSKLKTQIAKLEIYPNPVFGNAVVKYGLQEKTSVSLVLYDISGKLVKNVFSGVREKGYYRANIRENEFVQGVYFIKFKAGNYRDVRKLTILK